MQYLPKFYHNLARQKLRPEGVELYVARNYRRFPGAVPSLPALPDWVKVTWIENDLGPATKVLPAAMAWRGKGIDLLYCDDDRKYDPDWAGRMQAVRDREPEMVVCDSGQTLPELGFAEPKDARQPRPKQRTRGESKLYRLKRLLGLGLITPENRPLQSWGYVDTAEGYGGVLVKPDWFEPSDMEIPDILWTVDDIWLSGQLTRRGRTIRTTDRPLRPHRLRDSSSSSPLIRHVEEGQGRAASNRACVEYFQKTYGIWL